MTRNSAENTKLSSRRETGAMRTRILAVLGLLCALLLVSACAGGKTTSADQAEETPTPFGLEYFRGGSWDRSRRDGSQRTNWSDGAQYSLPGQAVISIEDPLPMIKDPVASDSPGSRVIATPGEIDPDDLKTAQVNFPPDAELPDPTPDHPAAVVDRGDELDYTVPQPGALLRFNLQNYTILTDTTHDWYTDARPTQKGLHQIDAEYVPGEGVRFTYSKDDNRPDPMVYLPVYDICHNINLRDYPYIAVCYKSTATNHNGVCYFATSNNPGLDESKNFGIELAPSDEWTIAAARAGRNGNWTGRLTALRFDIASGEFSGEIMIKWVGFFKSREDAAAFGVDGGFARNAILPDKQTFDRGENITFSVNGAQKGDWVLLVQEGDACYAPSVHSDDLYVSECMPLYWAEIADNRGEIDIDTSGGIYHGELLPEGRYDLVYMPRGRFVETARTTITITDNIVREPVRTETVYVTRGPEPTETPVPTEEPPEEETVPPTATPAGRDRMTEQPTQTPADNTAGKAGLIIALVAVACCAAALAVFFIVRRRKK